MNYSRSMSFLFVFFFISMEVSFACSTRKDEKQGSDDESDELLNCPYGEFECNDGKKCYSEEQKCDNVKDCDDNTDEDEHHCGKVITRD